jgi:hypothetical protein
MVMMKIGAVVAMLGREPEVLGENIPKCCFVHHIFHMT